MESDQHPRDPVPRTQRLQPVIDLDVTFQGILPGRKAVRETAYNLLPLRYRAGSAGRGYA